MTDPPAALVGDEPSCSVVESATEIREALNELAGLKDDGIFVVDSTMPSEGSSPTTAAGGSVT